MSFHRCLMLTITSPATCRYTPEPDHSCAKSAAKASARPARCADTKLSTPRYVAPGRAPARAQHPVPERRRWGEEGQGFPLLLRSGEHDPSKCPLRCPQCDLSLPSAQPHCARTPFCRKSLINATSVAKPSTAAPRSTLTSASTRATSPSSANFAAKAFTKKVMRWARPSPHLTSGFGGSPLAGRHKRIQREGARELQA